jgi:hemerythrin
MQNQVVIEYRWDESMRTGDDTVDAQHQELIRQLNLLIAAMARGEAGAQL